MRPIACSIMLATLAATTQIAALAGDKGGQMPLARVSQTTTNRTLLNINELAVWIHSNGMSARRPDGSSGAVYPRATAPVIFQDQLIWGGLVMDGVEPVVRVGGGEYGVGHVPGKIITQGVPEDRMAPNIDRVWRVRRDFATADLTQDTAEINMILAPEVSAEQIDQVRATYRQDWIDWPAERGAPFYDADGDGVYSPGFHSDGAPKLAPGRGVAFDPQTHADEPGLMNADQVVWLVVNDIGYICPFDFSCFPLIGIEIQITLWGYDRADALGHAVFRHHRLIYKGDVNTSPTARIDSMYIAQWSDPDVGSAGDDLAGCDIGLNLGYAYNSLSVDAAFAVFDLPPPAVGYDLVTGPHIDWPGVHGRKGLTPARDVENIEMTAFHSQSAGSQPSDPPLFGTYQWSLSWYNLMRGFLPRPIVPLTPFVNPSGQPTRLTVSGDPLTNTGWVDQGQGDRRIGFSSGPFEMALGDTQDVVIAFIGGLGSDRLMSVAVLKDRSRMIQQFVDNLFDAPKPPPAPQVTTSEFDGQILLNWGDDPDWVAQIEDIERSGFRFEGYNVYQLPAAGARLEDGVKLCTFDLDNGLAAITQPEFDPAIGVVVQTVVQIGEDSGVFRTFTVTRDILHDDPLFSGQEYHFAVTAYSYNPDQLAGVRSLESTPASVTVRRQGRAPGERLHGSAGDTLFSTHFGASDGEVIARLIDPTRLTGDAYEVVFSKDTSGVMVWHLLNSTRGDTLLRNQRNQSGDEDYLVTNGFMAVVKGPPLDFKSFEVVANARGPIDPPAIGAAEWAGFPVPERPGVPQQHGASWWLFHTADNGGSFGGGTRRSYSAFLSCSLRNDNFDRAVPYDWEMRFTARGSWAIRWFEDAALVQVPFELWNIGIATPDDTGDDYRLIPWFQSNGALGALQTDPAGLTYQLDPNDHSASGADNDPYTPSIYWIQPDDVAPGESGYEAYLAQIDTAAGTNVNYDGGGAEVFARTVLISWNGDDVSDGEVAPGTQMAPEQGTVLRLRTTKTNRASDRFTFSTSGLNPTRSEGLAREDVLKLVNVFPNPYYGLFTFENRFASGFVTFSHLPDKAIIRIFTLAGSLVRKLEKSSGDQFLRWDLKNHDDRLVAGGIYVAHVEMPDLGVSKVLKLAVIP